MVRRALYGSIKVTMPTKRATPSASEGARIFVRQAQRAIITQTSTVIYIRARAITPLIEYHSWRGFHIEMAPSPMVPGKVRATAQSFVIRV